MRLSRVNCCHHLFTGRAACGEGRSTAIIWPYLSHICARNLTTSYTRCRYTPYRYTDFTTIEMVIDTGVPMYCHRSLLVGVSVPAFHNLYVIRVCVVHCPKAVCDAERVTFSLCDYLLFFFSNLRLPPLNCKHFKINNKSTKRVFLSFF